jgi:hypothetical protein
MFSIISMNWRGKPLETLETVVNLITTTTTGLSRQCRTDNNGYAAGIKITD